MDPLETSDDRVPEPDPPDEAPVSEPRPPLPIEIEVDHDPHVNYAMQQNAVPVIKAVRLRNSGEEDLGDITLEIRAEPDLALPLRFTIAGIPTGAVYNLDHVDLRFSASRLVNLEESETGELILTASAENASPVSATAPLAVLAYGEWAGAGSLPVILAAFVQPNHPAIERFLRDARDRLDANTGDPGFSGYQSRDPERARAMLRAIYETACALDLTYINPPASFETTGQKIRTPDRVLEAGMGTCLDLVVFLAAAAEQAGLHPVLVLLEGHAVLGVWLRDECFVDAAIDEPARLRKRIDLGDILLLDVTGLTARPQSAFEEAVRDAVRHLDVPEAFHYAVDVRAARKERIRPLAARQGPGPYAPVALDAVTPGAEDSAPPSVADLTPHDTGTVEEDMPAEAIPETPVGRVERWKRKLLDMTLRNRFLNYRDTKKTVPLLCPDIARLEDMLSTGKAFAIQPEPQIMSEGDPRDPELHVRQTGNDATEEYLRDQLEDGQIHSPLSTDELEKRLVHVHREARVMLEEGGASALYLAVGFLEWYETDSSKEARRAPILLLPLDVRRDVVHAAFRMSLADDEPRANVTLLQKLAVDYDISIPELATLETDGSGLDVKRILDHVRRAVLVSPRWDVKDDLALGLFSFTKHLMWLDLEAHADRLMENAVVRHLIDKPEEPFEPDAEFPDPSTLDERHPGETYTPLDADSTQLSAVHAAAEGRTYVLEGPPGTGKSQTITNLIAHALACGRRVLFVSEKMAALNVVHHRLSRVGLGPFCLELHSNKAQKRKVLDQLRAALEFTSSGGVEDWDRRTEALLSLRARLNEYVHVLHRPRAMERTAFQGLAALIGLRGEARIPLDFGDEDAVDGDRRRRLLELTAKLRVQLADVGTLSEHPWRASRLEEWLPTLTPRIEDACRVLDGASADLEARAEALAEGLGLPTDGHSVRELKDLDALGRLFELSPDPDGTILSEPDWKRIRARIEVWVALGRRRVEVDATLRVTYRDALGALDLEDLKTRLQAADRTFWPLSWLKRRGPRRTLAEVLAAGTLPSGGRLIQDLDRAIEERDLDAKLAAAADEGRRLLGRHWSGPGTDWNVVERCLDWTEKFRPILARAAGEDVDLLLRLRERWIRLATEGRALFEAGGAMRDKLDAFREALAAYATARETLRGLVDLDEPAAYGTARDRGHLAIVRERTSTWRSEVRRLRGWSAYRRVRRGVVEAGLSELVEAVESGRLEPEHLERVFTHSLDSWWVERIFEGEDRLRGFNGAEQRDRIRRFRNLDLTLTEDTSDLVRARLADRIPRGAAEISGSSTSEMGLLQRELMKKRRHMPIRRLFERIPNLLSRIKPCMLMSPLSVAQYLSLESPPFDLVVFDEASQIPVWDAVGAIRRGERLIVVGDSKQLPPTTFFQRADVEEIEEDDIQEMESILDECIAARLPRLHLGWHYRSRHESLIAFSNARYYDNELLTFPSPERETTRMGLSWRFLPDAVYERGGSRSNPAEAAAVVAEIVERLMDPDRCEDSIGVVTFSSAQQTRIEDLLDGARRDHPEIDRFFGDEVGEPVFVKNLENVQGDERDVILFSVCYGPDARGRVAMNFGPLNRDGGERRLNVAVTRARRQVVIFSSIRGDQIDLARTSSVGVRHLREYLEYAEKGESVLGQSLVVSGESGAASPFEGAVREALEENGYEVVPQVGCSGYRIDLGVKDPDRPGRFLLGVECDGAMYESGRTARDRDRLRSAVLRNLGWRLHRIWSTDWWQDPEGEAARVLSLLDDIRVGEAETEPPIEGDEDEDEAVGVDEVEETPDSEPGGTDLFARSRRYSTHEVKIDDAVLQEVLAARPSVGAPYEEAAFEGVIGPAEEFFESGSDEAVCRVIDAVLVREAPISRDLLTRRVMAHWDHARLTKRIVERMDELLPRDKIQMVPGHCETILWRMDQDPDAHEGFRVRSEDGSGDRRPEDLPPEEVANAALEILGGHVSMSLLDLSRETARALGYARLGSRLVEAMEEGIRLLCARGSARMEGDAVSLP